MFAAGELLLLNATICLSSNARSRHILITLPLICRTNVPLRRFVIAGYDCFNCQWPSPNWFGTLLRFRLKTRRLPATCCMTWVLHAQQFILWILEYVNDNAILRHLVTMGKVRIQAWLYAFVLLWIVRPFWLRPKCRLKVEMLGAIETVTSRPDPVVHTTLKMLKFSFVVRLFSAVADVRKSALSSMEVICSSAAICRRRHRWSFV